MIKKTTKTCIRKTTTLRTWRTLLLLGLFYLATGSRSIAQTYCAPTFDNGCSEWQITNVQLAAINWSIGGDCTAFDNTNLTAAVTAGVLTPMTVSGTMWNGVSVYVDFNNDGDFDDAGEFLFGTYPNQSSWTENFNITVPAYVTSGSYRMRVIGPWGSGGGAGQACAEYQYGNYEDFTMVVTNNNTCYPPSAITITNTQSYQSDFNWTASTTNPINYVWEVVAAGTGINGTAIATGTTAATATTATATGLAANTSYDFYIRSVCSTTDSSVWYGPFNFITLLAPCNSAPNVGSITASQTTGCSPYISNLSIDPATASGITYQWESSTDGNTYTNINGATDSTYAANVTQNIYYEVVGTCTASSTSGTSTPIELLYTAPAPVYATVPFFEGFENWFGTCYSFDRPDASITLNPTYGDDSWRRDDQGTDAGWDDNSGPYSPVSVQGAHSARFHIYDAPSGTEGDMDLHIDLSTPGTKQIQFSYINQNTFSSDHLDIQLSEDGGATFPTTLASYPSDVSQNWQTEFITTNSVAANAVIRFAGMSDFGDFDLGVDSLSVIQLISCTGTPDPGTVLATQTSGCSEYFSTLTSSASASTGGLAYQWQMSTDNVTFAPIAGATNSSYIADITSTVYYNLVITCTGSGLSATTPTQTLALVTPVATYATLPYFEGFENWFGTCYNFDRPDSSITLNPTYGDDAWRRDDQGTDAGWNNEDGGYTPVSVQAAHSARFHSFGADQGTEGDMDVHINMSTPGTKQIQFSYINQNTSSTDHLDIELSEDGGVTFPTTLGSYPANVSQNWQTEFITINSMAANAVIRFAGMSDFGAYDLGVDSLSVTILPPCTGTPVAGTINTTQASGCAEYTPTLSLAIGTTTGGLTFQWLSSTDGVTYSVIEGATNYTYQADVTVNTWYRAVVTCTSSTGFDTTAALEELFVVPVATYATLPYFEGFESWIGSCFNFDRPGSNWLTNPPYGDNSWRRDDQGADAGWDNITDGAYSPASTEGAHSARFHSSDDDGPGPGSMDLYVDLSTPGSKLITFDYINTDEDNGSDLAVTISTDGGNTFTQIGDYGPNSGWTQEVISTAVTAQAIIRFQANANFIFGDMGMDSLNISLLPPCSGMPVAGTFSATQTVGCVAYTDTLSIDAPIYATGISYQWQSSTDGTTFTDIAGATNLTYMTNVSDTIYYRFYVACAVSNDTAFSTATEFLYTPEVVHTATLPYFQGFENWSGGACYSFDRPDSNWIETPASGNTAWRRDDQGADANWTQPTNGSYSPPFTEGAHSARFHNREAGGGNQGVMDLHIDLSPAGTKEITFDCIRANTSGSTLTISLSEDGGNTFTSLGNVTSSNVWSYQAFTTTSVSPTAVIRISATGGFSVFSLPNDVGLDSFNVFVLPPCTGMPVAGTFSNTQNTGCTPYTTNLSVDAPIQASGISYQWQSSTDGVTFTSIPGATGTTYSAGISATTYYRFYVACAASADTAYATATQFAYAPEVVSTASLPYFQGFENWTGTCSSFDRPDTNWLNNPNTGDGSWRRDDQGFDANWDNPDFGYDYFPTSTEGAHAARYHSYEQDDLDNGTEGDLDLHINLSTPGTKTLTFDYVNDDGDDFINVELSEDGGNTFNILASYQSGEDNGTNITGWTAQSLTITSVAANAIIRFAAFGDFGSTDMGIDSLNISGPPCDTVSGVTATNITAAGATINWTAVSGTAGYEVTIDQSSTNPAGSGTGVGTNSYTTSSLAAGTTYYAHVRDSCGPGSFSAWTTVSFTTLACDSITGLTVTGIGQTSATVSWNAVAGTAGYEIVVGTLPSTIIVATGTTNNSYLVTGLTQNTTYYVIVRDSCGAGNFSAPDTLSFTTPPEGIANVNGGQFGVDAYPNPANDIVTVRVYGITGDNRKVSLTDVAGRTISVMDMATDRVDFNMSNLAPGIYLVRYEDDAHTRIIKVNKQ